MADSKHPHEYMKYLREERIQYLKEWNYQINHLMI